MARRRPGALTVDLRCPKCERTDSAVLEQGTAERFDEELERGDETLSHDLARLTEAEHGGEHRALRAALDADAIQQFDF